MRRILTLWILFVLAYPVMALEPVTDGRVIVSTDTRFTGPPTLVSELNLTDHQWGAHPMEGYENSLFVDEQAPLVSEYDENVRPAQTVVPGLPEDEYYVYIRYSPHIQAKLVGSGNGMEVYDQSNAQSHHNLTSEGTVGGKFAAWQAYLGSVKGRQVKVLFDDAREEKGPVKTVNGGPTWVRVKYHGLIIRSSAQAKQRAAQQRTLSAELIGRAESQLDLLRLAVSENAFETTTLVYATAQLKTLKAKIDTARKTLTSADSVHQVNLALRDAAVAQRFGSQIIDNAPNRQARRQLAVGMAKHMSQVDAPFVLFAWPAMDNSLPDQYLPETDQLNPSVRLTACRGEFEPATFALLAVDDLAKTDVRVSDLRSKQNVLPRSAISVQYLKRFNAEFFEKYRGVLMNDDSLMWLDESGQVQFKDPDAPAKDAASFVPGDVIAGDVKQFWLSLHVPEDQPAGVYLGDIVVTTADGTRRTLPIAVEVPGFDLAEPMLDYGFFYNATLENMFPPFIDHRVRTEEQMRAELATLRAYGVDYPIIFQQLTLKNRGKIAFDPKDHGDAALRQQLRLVREAGFKTDKLIWRGSSASGAEAVVYGMMTVEQFGEMIDVVNNIAREEGFGEVYYYLIDEASAEHLYKQRPIIEEIHRRGGKVYGADNKDMRHIIGDIYDWPSAAPELDHQAYLNYFHARGKKVTAYMRPNWEVEDPQVWRRNYGLGLYVLGFDGAMPWIWTSAFREPTFKDWLTRDFSWCTMSLSTVDGYLPTLRAAWWREAIDDIRYVTTLQKTLEKARQNGVDGDAVEQAERLLAIKVIPHDLGAYRLEVIRAIETLAK